MLLVGATSLNTPAIEVSFAGVFDAIETVRDCQALRFCSFLSLGDFGLFGATLDDRSRRSDFTAFKPNIPPGFATTDAQG